MFTSRYFNPRYWASRFWPKVGGESEETPYSFVYSSSLINNELIQAASFIDPSLNDSESIISQCFLISAIDGSDNYQGSVIENNSIGLRLVTSNINTEGNLAESAITETITGTVSTL